MKNKQTFALPVVGSSSLLVIFAAVCLTVFALLSLTAVQSDTRLQQAAARTVTEYYAAEKQAEQILAQLRQGIVSDGVTEQAGVYSYACPLSETQTLMVAVRVEGEHYEILRWQTVYHAAWTPDESLPVWSGN